MIKIDLDKETTVAACDLCGCTCDKHKEKSISNDSWNSQLSCAGAILDGWIYRYKGRLQMLVCPKCQKDKPTASS